MRLVATIALICSILAGCAAPLGKTTYPKPVLDEYEGTWEVIDDAGLREGDNNRAAGGPGADVRVFLEVTRGEHLYPPNERPISILADRYYITARLVGSHNADDGLPTSMDIEGEFIRSERWTLFTFQPSLREQWAFDSLALWTPLQQTLRIDHAPDSTDLLVYSPRVQLVYVPVEMAGTLAFEPPARPSQGEGPRRLAQHMDDIFATLDKAEPQDWSKPMRLVRMK